MKKIITTFLVAAISIVSSSFSKTIIAFLFILSIPQLSYCQKNTGKWKCSHEMFEQWKLGYTSIKGNVRFKSNKTFRATVEGRSLLGHKFYPHRTISIKIKGTYVVKNDSIFLKTNINHIKCYVDPGVEDPSLSPFYEKSLEHTTWDSSRLKYEGFVFDSEVNEQSVREKMNIIWNSSYLLEHPDKNHLRIGKYIVLIR